MSSAGPCTPCSPPANPRRSSERETSVAAGLSLNRDDIDQRAGLLAVTLRNAFDEVDRFAAFPNAPPDNQLQTPPQSYSAAEVAQLKSAFADMSRLGRVYRGVESSGDVYDFRTFAKQLMGVM